MLMRVELGRLGSHSKVGPLRAFIVGSEEMRAYVVFSHTGLGPHVDAGSLSRWGDAAYRKYYAKIFSGMPEEHDAYDMSTRKDARQDLYGGSAHSSVLRAFQGWTALTEAGPKEGSLLIYPHLRYVVAYMLLRPFFDPPEDEKDIMDAEKWKFNADGLFFPGVSR